MNWLAAEVAFKLLLARFPNAPHQIHAHRHVLLCTIPFIFHISYPCPRQGPSSSNSIMVRGSVRSLKSTQMFGQLLARLDSICRTIETRPINFDVASVLMRRRRCCCRPVAQQRANICPADRKQVCDLTKKATENVNCAAAATSLHYCAGRCILIASRRAADSLSREYYSLSRGPRQNDRTSHARPRCPKGSELLYISDYRSAQRATGLLLSATVNNI